MTQNEFAELDAEIESAKLQLKRSPQSVTARIRLGQLINLRNDNCLFTIDDGVTQTPKFMADES